MARPQPIIVPGGLSTTQSAGFGETGEALGSLLGQFLAGRSQKKKEEEAQQTGESALFDLLLAGKERPVEAGGTPQFAAGGPVTEPIQERVAPSADILQAQALSKFLGTTPQGIQLGQQQAAKALGGLLAPEAAPEGIAISEVQSSSMLPNGLVQIVRKDGTTELVKPEEADKTLIEQAELRKAELQGLRASERVAAKNAQKISIDSFKQLADIRKSISTMDEGIAAIDAGAKSGVIQKRLPTIRDASLKLKNVQARMGLNVIQNTTFGSLSAEELKFALSAALPEDLDEVSLRSWLVQKKEAQRKLSAYVEEAAIFLGSTRTDEKGIVRVNKIADFIKLKKESAGKVGGAQPVSVPPSIPEATTARQVPQKIGRFTIEVE